MKFVWLITLIGAVLGTISFVSDMSTAQSAPQQAAGAAIALFLVIAPYVFARALEKLRSGGPVLVELTPENVSALRHVHATTSPHTVAGLSAGTKVRHRTHGDGSVVSVDDDGFATVRFMKGDHRMHTDYLEKV